MAVRRSTRLTAIVATQSHHLPSSSPSNRRRSSATTRTEFVQGSSVLAVSSHDDTSSVVDSSSKLKTIATRKRKRYADVVGNEEEEGQLGVQNYPARARNGLSSLDGTASTVDDTSNMKTKATRKRNRTANLVGDEEEEEHFDLKNYPARAQNGLFIGAHVSAAGGPQNAVVNAASIGANGFALFLKSQRKWDSKPLTDESIAQFKKHMNTFNYSSAQVIPHGSYLINLANPDREKREKSYECFLDDLKRCELLGLTLYNFHPGSTVGNAERSVCISHLASCISRAHKETTAVVVVIENMVGAGNTIGATFDDLASIIREVDDKPRVGFCLDTCHLFAAGFDIRTKEGVESMLTRFDQVVGLPFLRAMHINDSKSALGSHKDRHENIGLGQLGLVSFHGLVNHPYVRKHYIPLILETPSGDDNGILKPSEVWKTEISVLNRLVGTTSDDKRSRSKLSDGEDLKMEIIESHDALGVKLKALEEEVRNVVEKASKSVSNLPRKKKARVSL